jgi:hypothetical protein
MAEMDGYRTIVERAYTAMDGKDVVLNRTPEHASIVVEFLFRAAKLLVEIITSELVDATYGQPAVIAAALAFLRSDQNARIDILVEKTISPNSKLMTAIRDAGLERQVTITPVPIAVQAGYLDHVIVVDGVQYRYQKHRDFCDATIQFGNGDRGAKLHSQFLDIKNKALAV